MDKGKWIYDPNAYDWNIGGWRCGVCGCRNNNIGGPPNADPLLFNGSRFCPKCGDRKDGKEGPWQPE